MANPWFRMYAEFAHDPKVQMLSEQDQRRLIMLFCIRCNGSVTLQDKHVTFQLRISDAEWAASKAQFIELGFIDLGNKILNWDKRQFISDSSVERVRKHRALHKPVTLTDSNVTVTPPEQNRTEQNIINKSDKSDMFEKFWTTWPKHFRKGGKAECFKLWKQRSYDKLADQIIKHVEYCKGNGVWKDPQYIPAPKVYLSQSRWDGAETDMKDGKFDMQEFQRRTGAIPT